ncbi:MAG: hypothetical protein HKN76_00145 [Saprospiraceae bacterium]|nr:hypothetical protein [Saprospiraceae bacterium]
MKIIATTILALLLWRPDLTWSQIPDLHVVGDQSAGQHIALLENQNKSGHGLKIKIDGNHPLWVSITDTTGYFIPSLGIPPAVSETFDATVDAIKNFILSGNSLDLLDIKLSEIATPGSLLDQLSLQDLMLAGICKGASTLSELLKDFPIDSIHFSYIDTLIPGPYGLRLPKLPLGTLPADLPQILELPELETASLNVNPPAYNVNFPAPIGSVTLNPPAFNVPANNVASAIRKTQYNTALGPVNTSINQFNNALGLAYDSIVVSLDSLNGDSITIETEPLVLQIDKSYGLPQYSAPQVVKGLACPEPNPFDTLSFSFPLLDLDGHPLRDSISSANEFITFVDKGNRKLGAIKGQSQPEFLQAYFNSEKVLEIAGYITGLISDDGNIVENLTALGKEVQAYVEATNHVGVTYCSGYGDYAEWLPRENPQEEIGYGDIVGVRSGKISLDLARAEQLMVVSKAPIVLGNTPHPDSLNLGSYVAFIGQVPVKVIGVVNTGDYILADYETPGYGRAMAPNLITAENAHRVVGRSWETNERRGFKFVLTIVGLHNNHWTTHLKQLQEELAAYKMTLDQIANRLSNLENIVEIHPRN